MAAAASGSGRADDAYGDYLRAIARIPLMTPSEELHLGTVVQQWQRHPEPPLALERRGTRAKNRMVSANLRLVVVMCKRYQDRISNYQLDMLDLIQAGNLGLIRAVERFDPCRGYKLSTYAFWWIRQAVRRYINEYGRAIRIPLPILTLAFRAEMLQAASDERLSTGTLATQLGEEERRLNYSLHTVRQCHITSLDNTIQRADEDTSLINMITDGTVPEPDDDYGWLHEHLESLDPQEQQLLALRYGGPDRHSFAQAAEVMGMTKGNVQWREKKALQKLRNRLTPVLNP